MIGTLDMYAKFLLLLEMSASFFHTMCRHYILWSKFLDLIFRDKKSACVRIACSNASRRKNIPGNNHLKAIVISLIGSVSSNNSSFQGALYMLDHFTSHLQRNMDFAFTLQS